MNAFARRYGLTEGQTWTVAITVGLIVFVFVFGVVPASRGFDQDDQGSAAAATSEAPGAAVVEPPTTGAVATDPPPTTEGTTEGLTAPELPPGDAGAGFDASTTPDSPSLPSDPAPHQEPTVPSEEPRDPAGDAPPMAYTVAKSAWYASLGDSDPSALDDALPVGARLGSVSHLAVVRLDGKAEEFTIPEVSDSLLPKLPIALPIPVELPSLSLTSINPEQAKLQLCPLKKPAEWSSSVEGRPMDQAPAYDCSKPVVGTRDGSGTWHFKVKATKGNIDFAIVPVADQPLNTFVVNLAPLAFEDFPSDG